MIILEGSDNVGKTTLAKKLGGVYRHLSRPPEDFDHATEYIDRVFEGVQDRFHLGAVVYGAMLGGGGTYPRPGVMRGIQRYLRWQGCLVIVMHCPRYHLSQLLDDNGKEEMYGRGQILDANDYYRALVGSSNRGEPWCDMDINVEAGFPSDEKAEEIHEIWRARWNNAHETK